MSALLCQWPWVWQCSPDPCRLVERKDPCDGDKGSRYTGDVTMKKAALLETAAALFACYAIA